MIEQTTPPTAEQQIVVGPYIYQTGHPQGGLVYAATAVPPAAVPQPVSPPVTIRPRPFRQLLGREAEVAWVADLLQQQIPAEFYSEPGMGKTVLLRHLAHHPLTSQFPDGVVYLVASQEPAADLLYALYTAFYQSDLPHKPTESDLRRRLQSKNALVILDDFDLGRDDLNMLLNAAPRCTFLVSSPSRALWGDGEARALRGLSAEHALALLEREWGRPLDSSEQNTAEAICASLKGHPLRIQQTITAAREQQLSLQDVVHHLQDIPADTQISLPQLRQQVIAAFDDGELRDLCFDLDVDYENLPTQGKANKARELIELMVRNGRLLDLIAHCAQLRPHLNWGEPTQAIVDPSIAALPVEKRDILSVLAAFGDRPLSAELISQLVGQADVTPLLEALKQRGLVQNTDYHLAGSLPHRFHSDPEPMLLFLVEWATQQAAAMVQPEAKTLSFLQQWAVTNGRPAEALKLGQVLDEVLALDGRWGLWQQVLLNAQQAAQALNDQAAEAWALNQLGCRALCLGDKGVARIQLERAKALNEAISNEAGAAVNEHNLGLLRGAPVTRSHWRRGLPYLIGGLVLLLLLGWWLNRSASNLVAPATATATTAAVVAATEPLLPTDTSAPPQTAVPSATHTPIHTRTPSPTVIASETAVSLTATLSPTLLTPSTTATMTPTLTATTTPTPTATATSTNTATPSLTPSPTNTRWPTPLPTFTPGPVTQPNLIMPERGSAHRTNLTFQWRGVLQTGQRYRVQLRHTDSGFTLDSPLLSEPIWLTTLPAERFGEWYWQVAVVSGGLVRTSSESWHFYLDPFPRSDNPPSRPATPTRTPISVPPAPSPAATATTPPTAPTNTPLPPTVTATLPVPG